jgi:hypothetical protein
MTQHGHRRIQADGDAQGRRETCPTHANLQPEARHRKKCPQRHEFRLIDPGMMLEPLVVARGMHIERSSPGHYVSPKERL